MTSTIDRVRRLRSDAADVARVADAKTAAHWFGAVLKVSPAVARQRSLVPADQAVKGSDSVFRLPSGRRVSLSGKYFSGAREMYCRNVYLRTGLTIEPGRYALDLGANAGLFSVMAAVEGAQVVAVEAQRGFQQEIETNARRNAVSDNIAIEIGMIAARSAQVSETGVLTDDGVYLAASHSAEERVDRMGVQSLFERHGISDLSIAKIDIEGGEFGLLNPDDDLGWLDVVDQIAMELHPEFGSVTDLNDTLRAHAFSTTMTNNDGKPTLAADPGTVYLYARRR